MTVVISDPATHAWAAERAAYADRLLGRTCVYRAYDADAQILYVGIAMNWAKRWAEHSFERPGMADQVARLEMAWYETRAEALAVEEDLIQALRPPCNRTHDRDPREPRARPRYGYARFLDPEPLDAPPADLSRAPAHLIRDAASTLGMQVKTIRNLLSEFKYEFSRAYGYNAERRRIRLLSDADLYQLRTIIARWRVAEEVRGGDACQAENSTGVKGYPGDIA